MRRFRARATEHRAVVTGGLQTRREPPSAVGALVLKNVERLDPRSREPARAKVNIRTRRRQPMNGRTFLALAVCAALPLAAACSDGDGGSGGLSGPDADVGEISLRLRIHLLESSEFAALNSTLADDEVQTLLAGVNAIWKQANIRWALESVIREPAANQDIFARVLSGENPLTSSVIAALVPRGRLLAGEWDVFLVRDLGGGIGGIYIGGIPAIVGAELDPSGQRDLAGAGARILAHELGHSLNLQHVACTPEGNLLAPGCPAADRTRLTAAQIESARAQARTGHPF
jgi:hypothetical protein